ncbi:importin-alpha export receptor [Puccinia graminis f. sp. tritici]|uniref:Importin N-terminal domain-containing protein n=2 Tax=Puccinia graminis f. sp. tritici TaxID=56615 RepID=E3JVL5_PUCGT|nr:uncharacterized protein PGTG_02531 [Puccinia graminis f. sp. tritici CRL 75-36-700-3]EFP76090.2 hypothetical protein PGTG_02531 [Puccinia graminis f. sp. tritici CRL 75-36-700-3]KAA1117290.1 importin-alpha export receptor [Puccinia graminis f. sp. tritici]
MESNPETIKIISQCLCQSLNPDPAHRKLAEEQLEMAKQHLGFGNVLIAITQDLKAEPTARQAAALAFKNWVKNSWAPEEGEESQISTADRDSLKSKLVSVLISLANSPSLLVQYSEAISIIATSDFPEHWPDLIDQIVQNFNPNDWNANNALLSTAHAIFKRWRAQFRTDSLFLEIKYVLERFCEPYLQLFKLLDTALTNVAPTLPQSEQQILAKSLLFMIQIYYDLNCQDIPEYFEDHLEEFMNLLHKYLTWEIPYLASARQEDADDEEEGEAGELEKIRAGICEVVELYSLRYLDVFPMMDVFVKTCWDMLTRLGRQQRSDILVSKATRFLSVVVKMPSQRALFESLETLEAICEKIVLPNMFLRNFEVEMFEDDPAEFVRRDLEGSDNDTRRQAAIEITRALIEQFQKEVTAIITRYVQNYLQQYAADPTGNWRLKDAAVSLLASIASRSSTTAGGVTNTNALVDVVLFFSEQVVQDLSVKNSAPPHPIIVADAIKFLHTFRNQLTREQLISVMPLLVPHLNSEVSVIYTYAAITVERILFMKRNNQLLFSSTDLKDLAPELLTGLFAQIRKGTTPQQIAQNEMLMKCVMRVIVTAQKALLPHCEVILSNLIMILTEISKNPSNPKFNHYTFESISALIRFMTMADTRTLPIFEQALFPIFSQILTQDVQDFSPFVFQILSQMLELHTNHSEPLSDYYNDLLPPLLTPTLWELRGNVPALVRLLRAYLSAGAPRIVAENRISAMLGVFQKLIGSKLNDVYGFELLEALFEHVPVDALLPYLRNVFLLLLTRLQQSKTDKFTSAFLYTIMFIVTLEKPQLSPDLLINTINAVQPGLFSQVMEGVLLPAVASTPPKQRRVVALGHISLLTRARTLQCEAESRLYLPVLISVLRLFTLPQLKPTENTAGENSELNVTDLEEHGYQVGFSRLGASETIGKRDPFSAMVDPRDALASGLVKAGEAQPGKIPALISQVPSEFATPYLQWLAAAGYQIK